MYSKFVTQYKAIRPTRERREKRRKEKSEQKLPSLYSRDHYPGIGIKF